MTFAFWASSVAVAWTLGLLVGRSGIVRSLLIGADSDDRTPHKLGSVFYYLVPEREYCRLRSSALAERIRGENNEED